MTIVAELRPRPFVVGGLFFFMLFRCCVLEHIITKSCESGMQYDVFLQVHDVFPDLCQTV